MSRRRDIAVIGASYGGIEALRHIFERVPPGFPGVIMVVQHRSAFHNDGLAKVLKGNSEHIVEEPDDDTEPIPGHIYLAPRDVHLVVENARLRLIRGPKEHFTRPAIDPLFRSAAAEYGPRVVGVILSGRGQDGTRGLIAIKQLGGLALVQNASEARAPWMPMSAIDQDDVDAVLTLDEIANELSKLMNGRPQR